MDTCICMAESICSPPETITTLLIVYTPIQNKKLKKKKANRKEFQKNKKKLFRKQNRKIGARQEVGRRKKPLGGPVLKAVVDKT